MTTAQQMLKIISAGAITHCEHPQNPNTATDLTAFYEWSFDLKNWNDSGDTEYGTTVTISTTPNSPSSGTTTVKAISSGTVPTNLFLRLLVKQI